MPLSLQSGNYVTVAFPPIPTIAGSVKASTAWLLLRLSYQASRSMRPQQARLLPSKLAKGPTRAMAPRSSALPSAHSARKAGLSLCRAKRTSALFRMSTLSYACLRRKLLYRKSAWKKKPDMPLAFQVLGIVTRLTRVQAVLSIIAVDGKQCEQDWQGIIRIADIRQTEKDKIKIWDCFRPGDVVRASVVCYVFVWQRRQ